MPTIEFANDSTVLHEGRGPLLKVSDFILQCRTHSVIDVESSSNSKIRSVGGHESRGDSSVLPACRLRVFRPLSYFSPKSENIGSVDRTPFPLSIQPLTAFAILGYAKPDFAEAEGSNTDRRDARVVEGEVGEAKNFTGDQNGVTRRKRPKTREGLHK